MSWILSVYRQIPPELLAPAGAFFAAFLTALVAFTGVVISNRAAERRQRVELDAAEKRASTERDHTLRQTIYLETLDNLGALIAKVFDFWNVEQSISTSSDEASRFSGATYRTYLVASAPIIQALTEVDQLVIDAAAEAGPFRLKYATLAVNRQQMEAMLLRVQKERERLIEELSNESPNAERRSAIEARKQKLSEMEHSVVGTLIESLESSAKAALDILMLGARRRNAIQMRVFALVVAIREELRLPAVGDDTLRMLDKASEEALKAAATSLDNLKAMIPSLTAQAKASTAKTD